jgi:hypothetical protein
MRHFRKIVLISTLVLSLPSCSVQQFVVNTGTKPFENGGKAFGEKTRGRQFTKDYDLHIFGINVRNSDTEKMAGQLGTDAYTIESKSNVWVEIITLGIVDYKIVKVIDQRR